MVVRDDSCLPGTAHIVAQSEPVPGSPAEAHMCPHFGGECSGGSRVGVSPGWAWSQLAPAVRSSTSSRRYETSTRMSSVSSQNVGGASVLSPRSDPGDHPSVDLVGFGLGAAPAPKSGSWRDNPGGASGQKGAL